MGMTETPPDVPESAPEKLLVDDASNFPFHAAYLVYSDLFDKNSDFNVKKDLNRNMTDLKTGITSLETFYQNISRYRRDVAPEQRHDRFSVQTQRKKDWRMKSQKQERIRRHKK